MADNTTQITKPSNAPASAGDAARQGAQAAQQSGQAAGEALRRAADVTAETTQRSSQAGADTLRRAGDTVSETVRRGSDALADSQRQFMQKAAQQFEEASRKLAQAAQGSTEDLRTFMALPTAARGGLQDLGQSMTGLIEGVVRTNLQATQELLQLTNPSAFVELQQRFMRDYLDVLLYQAPQTLTYWRPYSAWRGGERPCVSLKGAWYYRAPRRWCAPPAAPLTRRCIRLSSRLQSVSRPT